jgi:XTP/dITP diphosphohydrolase
VRAVPVPIVIATRNTGKAREIAVALGDLPVRILTLDEADTSADYPERGTTFAANARGKAVFYSSGTDLMTLADDSGLVVDALGGAPGIYSARFSGAGATDGRNIRKLLRLLKNIPENGRDARFVCCMVLARRGRVIKQVTGRVQGRILTAGRGDLGFGYDPVFYYRPLHRTFGELEPEIKNGISHRGRAVRMMADFLRVFSVG